MLCQHKHPVLWSWLSHDRFKYKKLSDRRQHQHTTVASSTNADSFSTYIFN